MRLLATLLSAFLAAMLICCAGGGNNSPDHAPADVDADVDVDVDVADRIPYEVFDELNVNATTGICSMSIIIDPKYRNEKNLLKLGRQLRDETSQYRNVVHILIYDDEIAAANRDRTDKLSRPRLRHYHAHFLGSYSRNENTGQHVLTITPNGINGPGAKEVEM